MTILSPIYYLLFTIAARCYLFPIYYLLSSIGRQAVLSPIYYSNLLLPIAYLLSPISYLLSPISYLVSTIYYLLSPIAACCSLFPISYLLSAIRPPLLPPHRPLYSMQHISYHLMPCIFRCKGSH